MGSVARGPSKSRAGGRDREGRRPVRHARARARRGHRASRRRASHPDRQLARHAHTRARIGRAARARRTGKHREGRARASCRSRRAARWWHGAVDRPERDIRSARGRAGGRGSGARVRRPCADARRRAARGRCRATQRRLPPRGRGHRAAGRSVDHRAHRRSRATASDRAFVAGRAPRHLRCAGDAPRDAHVLGRPGRVGPAVRPHHRMDLARRGARPVPLRRARHRVA